MVSQWFYGRGSEITGPVTDRQLFDLATKGDIIPTDTIWREGTEAGVRAGNVRNLFQVAELAAAPAVVAAPPTDELTAVEPAIAANETVAILAPPPSATPVKAPPKTGRASAGKGAIILSQDGKTVKYKGKCTVCGREDSSYKSIPIPRGTTRAGFFCAKCRKRRDVEIHGII